MSVPYGTLILRDEHAAKLSNSAVDPVVAAARGYESTVVPTQLALDGFLPKQYNNTPGLRIPLWNIWGIQVAVQYRPNKPRYNGHNKPLKYETPKGAHPILDCHPFITQNGWLTDPNIPIWITEGSIKADAGVSHGLCVLALSGVWNWRTRTKHRSTVMLGEFDSLPIKNRRIIIVFDSDAWTNGNIYKSVKRFAANLEARGAIVLFAILPDTASNEKQGLDDYLKTHTVEQLKSTVVNHLPKGPDDYDRSVPINGYRMTDTGNAERFRDRFRHLTKYVHEHKSWYIWNGTHWQQDTTLQAEELAKQVPQELYAEIPSTKDEAARKELTRHAVRTDSAKNIAALLTLARSDRVLAATPNDFDNYPFLLNTLNGTLDLESNTFYDNDINDRLTQLIPYNYTNISSPDWDLFIKLITKDDPKVSTYLQRVAGYCLTGSQKEGSIFFNIGPSRTGKTAFLRALLNLFGSYGTKTKFDTFLSGRRPGSPRPEVAVLEGKRLVVASEAAAGQRFDEATLKELTAGDPVTDRQLYQQLRTYVPQLKIMLAANTFPYVRSDDSGIWNRIKVTNFDNLELAERQHLDLKIRIQDPNNTALYEAVLNWAVNGALDWIYYDDLAVPETTTQRTEEQQKSFKPLTEWIDECCERDPEAEEDNEDLWSAYNNYYMQDRTHKLLGRKGFAQALESEGITLRRTTARRLRIGLRLVL